MFAHLTSRSSSPAWLLVAAALCSAASARAEAPESLETARRLFHEAAELEEAHAWDGAIAKLKEALALKDTPGLRFHLAHCEEQSGQLVAARGDYVRATALIQAGASAPDVEKLLPDAIAALERRIPTLQIVLPPDSVGASVELDGLVLQPFTGAPLPVNPKQHRVAVTQAASPRTEQTLTLVEGERRVLSIEGAKAGPPPAKTAESAPVSQGSGQAGPARGGAFRSYALVGESALVLAGLGVGLGFAVARSSASDRATQAQRQVADIAMGNRAACASPNGSLSGPCHDFSDALADRDRDGTWETVGFVTAGVSAGALLASLLLWPRQPDSEHGYSYQPWLGRHTVGVIGHF